MHFKSRPCLQTKMTVVVTLLLIFLLFFSRYIMLVYVNMTGTTHQTARTQNSRHTQIISQHLKCAVCMLGAKINSKIIIIIIESKQEEEKKEF